MNNPPPIAADDAEDEDAHWAFHIQAANHIPLHPEIVQDAPREGQSDITSMASGNSFQLAVDAPMPHEDDFVPLLPAPVFPGGIGMLNIQLAYGLDEEEEHLELVLQGLIPQVNIDDV